MQLHEEIDRKATREVALQKVKRLNMAFYVEASAKTGHNIEKIFQVLIDILLERLTVPITVERFKKSPYMIFDEWDFFSLFLNDKN